MSVYEMEVNAVACMKRRKDGWLNATQILKVAGVDKGKRTKVLEKEILTGHYEKVQGGYGKYQGTWISYQRGREFCRQYGVEDMLRPLLDYDMDADGATGGQQDTPTKEQAMAAQRKKFYNGGMDGRNGMQQAGGTFFSNISPMSSVALAAMNKAARINSPGARSGNPYRQSSSLSRQPSQQQIQGMNPSASQQSMMSESSFGGGPVADSAYPSQNGWRDPGQEPPRKRMRASQDDGMQNMDVDASMRSATPTEPNESFIYNQQQFADDAAVFDGDEPTTLPPLPAPQAREEEEKKALLLDLFADSGRMDYSTHPAITQLSADDLNIPLDTSANTALHWAATLARVPLLRLLIAKGANIRRGNVAGQSALISAVLVNNSWELSCFPDILELLGALIDVRDAQGRTILHHIAVSCGIKGRAPSSKYYLEALLEFLVRSASTVRSSQQDAANGEIGSQEHVVQSSRGAMSLMRFLSTIVNARDKTGNTALNLVARIGNRSIIQQLLEIKADPSIANYKGVSARDFGVGVEDGGQDVSMMSGSFLSQPPPGLDPGLESPDKAAVQPVDSTLSNGSQAEDQSQDVISCKHTPRLPTIHQDVTAKLTHPALTNMLTTNLAAHKQLLATKTAQIDALNAQIRELSAQQKQETDLYLNLQRKVKARTERRQKIANLRHVLEEKKGSAAYSGAVKRKIGDADTAVDPTGGALDQLDQENLEHALQSGMLASLPSTPQLRALLAAYERNNTHLSSASAALKSRSVELEQQYRKVIALCTGTEEERVDECLGSLIAAVESEREALGAGEVGRIREFLMKVEGVANE